MPISKVIIVGAGPSGLLLGLLLTSAGIPAEVLEQAHTLDTNPRAAHYAPPSVFELDRAGVLEEVRAKGFTPESVSWRKLDERKTRIATIGRWARGETGKGGIDERMRMVVLPLHRLDEILERRLKERPNAVIRYGYKVVGLGQDGEKAWVEVETRDGKKRIEGDYVVGCDGANSKVRKCLFREDTYPGYTWDRQIVATNTYYNFGPYDYDDSQFFIHPEHYHMVAKLQADGLYRITYGEIGGLTTEQMRERQPKKFEIMLPGNPKPDQYRIINFSPYKIHQRCVDHMRVGRILLAADAAHLCNPFGGMGLTGGIADVGSLFDSFNGIHTGQADESILDIYDEVRRKIWHDIINPVSTDNIKRLFDQDADTALENDPFLKLVKQAELDPDFAAKMQGGVMSVKHDMTQYYRKEKRDTATSGEPGLESTLVEAGLQIAEVSGLFPTEYDHKQTIEKKLDPLTTQFPGSRLQMSILGAMTTFTIEESEWSKLSGKTILIVGGSRSGGIGRAAVEIAHRNNANVALGDWNEEEGEDMSKELKDRFYFQKCDVTQWDSILDLFEAIVSKFGEIHAVLSNAGIAGENFLADEIDPRTGRLVAPDLKTLDVNLYGMTYVTKAALHYFSKWPETQCQLVLTGSVASYIDGYSIPLYNASKMGVLGLVRGLRCMLYGKNVSLNMVAPWATNTQMLRKGGIDKVWDGLPMNTAADAARALLLPVLRPKIHGKSFWVGGGDIIEVEDKTHEMQPIWLTQKMSDDVDEGQHRIVPNFEHVVLSYRKK